MTPAELAALHAAAKPLSRSWSADEFADLLAHPGHLLATGPDSFALGRLILDEAELLMLATHPRARRQGQGRATLAAFHRMAAQRGAATVFLEVAVDNSPARTLYGHAGYVQAGRRRGYYTRPGDVAVDALILRRILPVVAV